MKFILIRTISLLVIVTGVFMSQASQWYVWILGLLLFVAGVIAIEDNAVARKKFTPRSYSWSCPICKNKGSRFSVSGPSHELVLEIRIHHNRTAHLMEY